MSADQRDVEAAGNQRFKRWIGRRLGEAVEPAVLQVRDAWRELEAEQGEECEDVFRIAAAVGVVAANRDIALVIQQAVEDMQSLARRRRDYLGEERRKTIGDVRIEFASRIVSVMGVEAAGVAAEAAGPEELSVRRRSKATAEYRRQRLALLMIDEAPQGEGVGLVANMPIGNPGELTEAGDRASIGHSGKAKIEAVGQQARHQDARIRNRFAAAQMREAVGEQRPARHLG
jgi:hypothetical protein